ncbi:MAG: hypothetical protein K0R94_922 [Burkholderiales bacterium]|jgi:hypothetical protein|nr:hypothetical protein [Burkholderiales bacterium]
MELGLDQMFFGTIVLKCTNVKYLNPYQIRHIFISYANDGKSSRNLYKLTEHFNTERIYMVYSKLIKGGKTR